jgi:hypothetical protein
MKKLCECGCGQPAAVPTYNARKRGYVAGVPTRFAHGHGGAMKMRGVYRQPNPSARLSRERASKLVTVPCELAAIGGCSQRRHVHHRDENPLNNDPANLIALCSSHHALVHAGRVDLANPVMPDFYVSSGKRRYRGHKFEVK